jgi:hypothetical protein
MTGIDDGSRSNANMAAYAEWWNTAVAASETSEVLEALWLPRSETTKVWGSKFFDCDLNPLSGACDDAALVVQLIRDPQEAACHAKFEVRTNLALSQQLCTLIADAQRDLAERAGLSLAEPGAAKPHVLTRGERGLVRAYGQGSIFQVQEAAQPRLRAYWFLASVWRAALIDQKPVTIARVRRIAEDAIAPDNMDMRFLFARPNERGHVVEGRPELTDELLARLGLALGCRLQADGRYGAPVDAIMVEKAPPPGVVRMVAQDLAPLQGVDDDTILRKTLQPMLAGELNGPILRYTAAEAAAVRTALEGSQVRRSPGPEN